MTTTAMNTMGGTRLWDYQGRDTAGKLVKGRIEAATEGAVVERMRGLGIVPVKISEGTAGTGLNREISFGGFGGNVGLKDLAILSRQAATMVSAGLSLLKTLSVLTEQTENKKLKQVLVQVTRDVESGYALSDAMSRHEREFPPLMVNMIRAGETGGFLEGALETVATNYEKEAKLRSTVKSAMTYPVMVLSLAVVAVVAMLLFIVPIFEEMFSGMGSELPLPTQFLVLLSKSMVFVVPVLVVGGLVFSVWWRANKNADRVRGFVDPLKLKIPVFGPLLKKIAITRFARNLADMVAAGVPILQALTVVGETSGNWVVEQAAKNVAASVRSGKSIAGPLSEEAVFPRMAVQMIAVGEDSGALETMLKKVADFYDSEVQATTEALTSIIEPLLVAVLGVVVGGMIVALYMPIFNIVTLV